MFLPPFVVTFNHPNKRIVNNYLHSDTALKIAKKYKDELDTKGVLGILAGKPEAFQETKSNIITRTIKSGNQHTLDLEQLNYLYHHIYLFDFVAFSFCIHLFQESS